MTPLMIRIFEFHKIIYQQTFLVDLNYDVESDSIPGENQPLIHCFTILLESTSSLQNFGLDWPQ